MHAFRKHIHVLPETFDTSVALQDIGQKRTHQVPAKTVAATSHTALEPPPTAINHHNAYFSSSDGRAIEAATGQVHPRGTAPNELPTTRTVRRLPATRAKTKTTLAVHATIRVYPCSFQILALPAQGRQGRCLETTNPQTACDKGEDGNNARSPHHATIRVYPGGTMFGNYRSPIRSIHQRVGKPGMVARP